MRLGKGIRGRVRLSRGLGILLTGAVLAWGISLVHRMWVTGTADPAEWVRQVREGLVPWAVMVVAAATHELGHLVAAWGVGVKVRGIALDLLGARLELEGGMSYGQECFVAAGGPFVSLVLGAAAYPLAVSAHPWSGMLWGTSLLLGAVNLLPVGTLDGGRMLYCTVALRWSDRAATGVLRGTTGFFLGLLWLLSVYGLLRGGALLSCFAFSLCLLGRTLCEGESPG